MRTLIVGAGSLGCVFAALFKEGGADVTLFEINEEKAELIAKGGLVIRDGNLVDRKVLVPCVSDIEAAPPPDLILVLVKAYHTERAAREIRFVMGPETKVLTLQNGLGHIEVLAKHLPKERLFAGITYMSALQLSEGHVHHTGNGLTIIAPVLEKSMAGAMELARYFNDHGISAGATSDLDANCWKKLIVNSAINPLTTIYRIPNGALPKKPEAVRDMAALVIEGVAVAQKVGVPLNYGEMWAAVLETCRQTAENRSSMLMDVESGRPTEIDAINGSIIRIGETYGVDTPTHMRMLKQVTAIQRGRGE